MHKSRVSTHLGSSLCIACDGVSYARRVWCAVRATLQAAHKANHTIKRLDLERNAIGDDGAVALADAMQGVACDVRFPWNMTGIFVTSAEQCLTTDLIAHETGTGPSSQCQTCCVARNFSHRMAKSWNIRSDGVCVVCRGIVFAMLITCNP